MSRYSNKKKISLIILIPFAVNLFVLMPEARSQDEWPKAEELGLEGRSSPEEEVEADAGTQAPGLEKEEDKAKVDLKKEEPEKKKKKRAKKKKAKKVKKEKPKEERKEKELDEESVFDSWGEGDDWSLIGGDSTPLSERIR